MKIALANGLRLAAVTGVGIGIMWALQALGFGPAWLIGAATGAGAVTGAVLFGVSLHDMQGQAPEIA